LAAVAIAQEHHDRAANDPFTLKPLAGNVYALYGRGGNVGFYVGPDAVVVVDSQFKDLAPGIVEKIKSVTDKPIKYLVNTHHHGDHVGGNEVFRHFAVIIGHDNVRTRMLASPAEIAPIIRSSGTFNVKARRLAAFVDFLGRRYGGRVEKMAGEEPWELRRQLLEVPGIGRETADCIVLYAAGHPLFVVDGYTRRIFSRLGMIRGDESYDDVQLFFMRRLPGETRLFNDYHAQIVGLAQQSCRARPRCTGCPLDDLCPKRGVA